MRRIRKLSFNDLVNENKLEILNSEKEMEEIEKKIEERRIKNTQ